MNLSQQSFISTQFGYLRLVCPTMNHIFNTLFMAGFHLIVCGLDSIVARRWINGMVV